LVSINISIVNILIVYEVHLNLHLTMRYLYKCGFVYSYKLLFKKKLFFYKGFKICKYIVNSLWEIMSSDPMSTKCNRNDVLCWKFYSVKWQWGSHSTQMFSPLDNRPLSFHWPLSIFSTMQQQHDPWPRLVCVVSIYSTHNTAYIIPHILFYCMIK